MKEAKFIIVGGGMVAGHAAKQLVEMGLASGELAILSAEAALPYDRPPLSKGFLSGKDTEESIRINPENFYRKNGIEVRFGCEVTKIDPVKKRLVSRAGEEFRFDKLIVATGAAARRLPVRGADIGNVLYLRSLSDSKLIRERAKGVKQAVVIGGGFIGMEVAAVLTRKGVEVTMVLREDRIWKQFFSEPMSRFFESYYVARGVRIVKSATIKELRGDGTVSSVALADGKAIPCQMVVAGIGARPMTELFGGSGIAKDDGVMVNEYLETSAGDVFAAGDIANYPDILFDKRRRVEHWDNAIAQGQHCARALMGERKPFRHVPYFFSDVFDLSYEYWGDGSGADAIVQRGDLAGKSFSTWWLRQGVVVAAFVMSRPDEERSAAPKWIEAKQRVSAERLGNASSPIQAAEISG